MSRLQTPTVMIKPGSSLVLVVGPVQLHDQVYPAIVQVWPLKPGVEPGFVYPKNRGDHRVYGAAYCCCNDVTPLTQVRI